MPHDAEGAPRRGRPLDPAVEIALREAAFTVLSEHGWRGTTIERIAEVAGVARTTVYRRYGSMEGVMLMLLAETRGLDNLPDTGSLRGDLLQIGKALQALWSNAGRVDFMGAVIAARRENAEVAKRCDSIDTQVLAALRPVGERARARGELRADADFDILTEIMAVTLMQRALRLPGPMDERSAEQLLDAVLPAFQP